jgi:PHS family inorganic phosphate transporter-like MFS transporter
VKGDVVKAANQLRAFSAGVAAVGTSLPAEEAASPSEGTGLWAFLSNRRMLRLVLGTAGGWLLFDYAYYGNTLSLPTILKDVSPAASISSQLLWTLGIFVVCAVPGYILAFTFMDRIGHRRLQLIGFSVMAVSFLLLGVVPALTAHVGSFLAVFGISYLFIEFGPNTTTFVLPSELFPTRWRSTGHGLAASIGKLGAFIGVFLVPALASSIGLRGMLVVAAGASVAGFGLTCLLPEPSRRSLDEISGDAPVLQLPVLPPEPSATAAGRGTPLSDNEPLVVAAGRR